MLLLRNVSTVSVVVVAALVSPFGASSAAEPLAISADYSVVAQEMAAAGYGEMAAGRQFASFDPAGDGRVVEVLGSLAAAERVVVLVPGSDTTLANFDRGLGGVSRRAPAVQARVVYDAIRERAADARVAVVAWLGYDPPEGLGLAAMRRDRAIAGAADLKRFVASLPPHASVTVVGHSYGSVVVGLAAPGFGPRVTDIVALANPGMSAGKVSSLHTGARVWVATAPGDWIGNVPNLRIAGLGHGALPADARALPTDGVLGHDGYLVRGSTTLAAITELTLGIRSYPTEMSEWVILRNDARQGD